MAAPVAVWFPVCPVSYTVTFILYRKPIFVRLSEPNTACHKLETVTSAQFTLLYNTHSFLAGQLPPFAGNKPSKIPPFTSLIDQSQTTCAQSPPGLALQPIKKQPIYFIGVKLK